MRGHKILEFFHIFSKNEMKCLPHMGSQLVTNNIPNIYIYLV